MLCDNLEGLEHRELSPMLCDNLEGLEWGGGSGSRRRGHMYTYG